MTVAVDALKSDTFEVRDKIALPIKLFTHDVVGMLEELSTYDSTDDIFGFIKKVVGVFMFKPEDRLPEPIVTLPVVKLEPIFNSEVSFFTICRNSLTGISLPLIPFKIVLKKFVTVTPGMAVGYWKLRKIPSLALSSGFRARMDSPLNKISPPVIE